MTLNDLPPPPVATAGYGSVAKHFERVPTERLVREMQDRWEQVDDDELADEARQRGEYTVDTFLVALHERADRSVLDVAAALLATCDRVLQIQGLRILRELGPPDRRPVFPEIWEIVEPSAPCLALCNDGDADVRWSALWEAKEHLDQSRADVRAAIERRTTDPDSRVRALALSSATSGDT